MQAKALAALIAMVGIVCFYANTVFAAPAFEEPLSYPIADFDGLGEEDWGGQVLDSVVADFNNDDFMDIAATYIDGNTPSGDYNTPAGTEGVAILMNDGDGTYTIASYISYDENLVSITAADFDNDGDVDLATANSNTDEITILINNGSGSFAFFQDVETGLVPEKILHADFDGDSDIDLIVSTHDATRSFSSTGNPGVQIFLNDGYSNFSLSGAITDQTLNEDFSPTYVDYSDFVVFDFDGDSDSDVVLAGSKNLEPVFLFAANQGDGEFATSTLSVPEENYTLGSSLNKILPTDVDSDGDADLLIEGVGYEWLLMLNNGLGAFGIIQSVGVWYVDRIIPKDFDLDGDEDILGLNSGTNGFSLLTNSGFGSFTREDIATTSTGGFTSLHAEDLNNDGKQDIAVTSVDHQVSVTIFLQIDDGEQTPTEQTRQLITDVIALDIPNNLENSYLANLFKVEGFIENGQTTPAINQLTAFINKVNQDYNQGKITLAERNNLVAAAQQLIDDLSN